jgi:predicted NUDIX family NTP pyrophosphohydrolase
MIQSAGTLLFRQLPSGVEVLLVHPSGNYNRRAPWSIPKGLVDTGESFEVAARRETVEETGIEPTVLVSIGEITYTKSHKKIHCFIGEVPPDTSPRCASWEVDRAEFVPLENARGMLHPDQALLLDRLAQWLAVSERDSRGENPFRKERRQI